MLCFQTRESKEAVTMVAKVFCAIPPVLPHPCFDERGFHCRYLSSSLVDASAAVAVKRLLRLFMFM
jgi:hypothetical protein